MSVRIHMSAHKVESGLLTAEAHAQVSTAPEEVGHGTTTGDVAAQPADVRNSALLSDVSHATLVRVLEGTNLLGSPQLLLAFADRVKDLVTLLTLSLGLGIRQLLQLLLDSLGLGHGVEKTGKESTLLTGNLGGRGVVGNSTVTNGPDVLSAVHDEVLVHSKTTTRVLLGRELVHQIADNGANSVTGSPDQQTVGNTLDGLGSIRVGDHGLDVLVGDVLDHSLSADRDLLLLEGRFSVVDKLLGEHGKDVGQSFDEGDLEVLLDFRNPLLQVILEEVLQLTGELDTSRATTNHNHVEKTLDFVFSLVLEHSSLNAVHDALADLLSIVDLLQEAGVLPDTGDT